MRITHHILAAALLVTAAAAAAAPPCFGRGAATTDDGAAEQSARPARIFLVLASGAKTEVEEVAEKPEGFWFRRGNVWTLLDRSKVARVERESPAEKVASAAAAAAPKAAASRWSLSDSARVESFFVKRFGRTLPVTAFGQSGLHNRWGYDHRLSLDVGLHPDSPEGKALIAFLSGEGLPFMGFRSAIPGMASGPHIHIGLPSRRLTAR